MAGTVTVTSTNSLNDEWEIHFARFIHFPLSIASSSSSSDLQPLPHRLRNRPPRGTWISSNTSAFLRFSPDHSFSDVILTVSFNAKLLEEHYVSKLNFSWPQVSCDPGFPARGISTVLVSYRDSVGQIQKFAMRFPSIYETKSFINALKEILKDDDKGPEPLNIDFGSEISSQSEFMSTNNHSYRASEEPSFMTPADTYIPQRPLCINNKGEQPSATLEKEIAPGHNFESILPALPLCITSEGEQPSGSQKKEIAPGYNFERILPSLPLCITHEGEQASGSQKKEIAPAHNFESILPTLPPSFATFLMDCSGINHAQATVTEGNDFKAQIARYMEDSSFQDMLVKVEKVIEEIGGDMSLS